MNETEHLTEFLRQHTGPTVLDVNRLFRVYEQWAAGRPKLTPVMLVKRLVGMGAFKRRYNGLTLVDFTGVE